MSNSIFAAFKLEQDLLLQSYKEIYSYQLGGIPVITRN